MYGQQTQQQLNNYINEMVAYFSPKIELGMHNKGDRYNLCGFQFLENILSPEIVRLLAESAKIDLGKSENPLYTPAKRYGIKTALDLFHKLGNQYGYQVHYFILLVMSHHVSNAKEEDSLAFFKTFKLALENMKANPEGISFGDGNFLYKIVGDNIDKAITCAENMCKTLVNQPPKILSDYLQKITEHPNHHPEDYPRLLHSFLADVKVIDEHYQSDHWSKKDDKELDRLEGNFKAFLHPDNRTMAISFIVSSSSEKAILDALCQIILFKEANKPDPSQIQTLYTFLKEYDKKKSDQNFMSQASILSSQYDLRVELAETKQEVIEMKDQVNDLKKEFTHKMTELTNLILELKQPVPPPVIREKEVTENAPNASAQKFFVQ